MTTRRFAADTSVPVERSRAEIETALKRYGADSFISGWENGRAMLGFRVKDRMVRFILPLPQARTRQQCALDGCYCRSFRPVAFTVTRVAAPEAIR